MNEIRGLDHAFAMPPRTTVQAGDYGLYTFPAKDAGLGSALGGLDRSPNLHLTTGRFPDRRPDFSSPLL